MRSRVFARVSGPGRFWATYEKPRFAFRKVPFRAVFCAIQKLLRSVGACPRRLPASAILVKKEGSRGKGSADREDNLKRDCVHAEALLVCWCCHTQKGVLGYSRMRAKAVGFMGTFSRGIACCAQPRRWPIFRCPLKLQMSGDSLGPLRRPGFPQKRRFGAEFL